MKSVQWISIDTIISQFHVPLYNAELITPPANAMPKPNCPILLNICAILIDLNTNQIIIIPMGLISWV